MFKALEQEADFEVGVAVNAVLDLAALAEESVSFIEEQQRLTVLGLTEGGLEVFLSLADPFGDDLGQVDLEQDETEHSRDDLSGEGLASAGFAGEQSLDAACAAAGGEAPVLGDPGPGPAGGGELQHHLILGGREDEILGSPSGDDRAGEAGDGAAGDRGDGPGHGCR